jgi:FAD binding domain
MSSFPPSSPPSSSPSTVIIPLHRLYHLLQPLTVVPDPVFRNWGRTFTCTPSSIFRPENEEQLELILQLARRENKVVRAVGVGHSPSDLACTSGYMVQMHLLDEIIEVRKQSPPSYLFLTRTFVRPFSLLVFFSKFSFSFFCFRARAN